MPGNDRLLQELFDYLRIPSISSGGGDPRDLERAAEWVRAKILAAGGTADIQVTSGNPLVIGELRAARDGAPTVMIYGHYDVQSPDPLDGWTTPPFEPTIRDDRIYGRGASDDKGNFFPLLYVACELADRDELPLNVRIIVDGEEEIGGQSAVDRIAADARGADAAIVFDSDMVDPSTPAITLGVRGLCMVEVTVTTAPRALHSGIYGGVALNALHVLHDLIGNILPDDDGRPRKELWDGLVEPSRDEIESWMGFPSGSDVLREVDARPISARAADEIYVRTWSQSSVDVHGIEGGDAAQDRTIIPGFARARLSVRLAPEQDADDMSITIERLLTERVPDGAQVTVACDARAKPALFDPTDPAIALARTAIERACGAPAALQRSGGSIPVLAAFYEKGIPTILSGFALASDNVHAIDESFRLESLRLGEATSRALYEELSTLPARAG